jgi:P4 family phage/plasmid primase-like protien
MKKVEFVQGAEDFIKVCREWSGQYHVYAGLNPRKRRGGTNEDIARRTAILIDIDRHHGDEGATEEELKDAENDALKVVNYLKQNGHPEPYVDMSGNGYHIIPIIDLPVDATTTDRIKEFYKTLPAETDPGNADLARLCKVTGTMSLRGTPRLSFLVSPGEWEADKALEAYLTSEAKKLDGSASATTPEAKTERRTSSLKPCFKRFAEEGGKLSDVGSEDNLLRLALVVEAHSKGYSRDQIIDLFRNAEDFNLKITTDKVNRQLGDIAVKGIKPWSCRAIHKHNGCLGETCNRYKKQIAKYFPTPPPDPGQPAPPEAFFDEEDNFIPERMAQELLKEFRFAATSEKSKVWTYKPDKGIWENDGAELIHEEATKRLKQKFKTHHVSETVAYIRYTNYIDQKLLGGTPGKIVVQNGVLDLNTYKLTHFDPNLYEICRIPVSYDPTATCPKIVKFLNEVLHPKKFDTIIEVIGYCLLKSYPLARIIIFVGEGANGKSQLIVIINNFLGRENTSKLTLQQIAENTFAPAQLFGKLANLAADIPATPIKYTGIIKALTGGGDEITAHHKYFAMFDFMNYAKLIFSVNEVPPTDDTTPAWLRRPVLIEFPNTFPAGDPGTILDIGEKISTPEELSGLLNLALAGLQRLLKQGKFTGEESFAKRAEQYIRESNPAQYFITQFVEEDPNTLNHIEKTDLYKKYVTLCHALKRRPLISNKFSMEIPLYLPYIDDGEIDKVVGTTKKGKPQTRKTRVWYGIRIKNEELAQRIAELKNVNIDTIDSSPLKTQKKKEEVRGVRREREGNDRIDIYKNGDLEKKVLEKVIIAMPPAPGGGAEPLNCPYCTCRFATQSDLDAHVQGLHTGQPAKPQTPSLTIGLGMIAAKTRELVDPLREELRRALGWPQEYFDKVLDIAIREKLVWMDQSGIVRPR